MLFANPCNACPDTGIKVSIIPADAQAAFNARASADIILTLDTILPLESSFASENFKNFHNSMDFFLRTWARFLSFLKLQSELYFQPHRFQSTQE